jgi:hypothetical protein
MRRLINWFSRLDMNVILVCHEKEEYGLNAKNEREVIGYTYDCWDRLEYELDLVIRIEKQGPRRTMRVRKSRISSFEEGRVYDWNYNNFATMYGEDTIQREVESIKLATGEQVHEILRLIDLMKVSSEDTARWLTKANAESFDELSMDQASKTLEFLNSKLRGAA